MPYKQMLSDIKAEMYRMVSELDKKNMMLAASMEEQNRLKHHIECLEKGTRTLKSQVQAQGKGCDVYHDGNGRTFAFVNQKLLKSLTLDIATAVVCGGFKTSAEGFAELKRLSGS